MKIEIRDRLYDDIAAWCEANSKNTEEYIASCVEERFMTDKYGDLNVILGIEKKSEEVAEKPKRTRKKKDDVETVIEAKPVVEQKPLERAEQKPLDESNVKDEAHKGNVDAINLEDGVKAPKKTIKRTRVLTTK